MKVRKILIVSLILIAFLATGVGLSIYFFAFKNITEVPGGVEIVRFGGKYHISTEYNPNYNYRFKIEKWLTEDEKDHIVLKEVDCKENFIEFDQPVEAGQHYQISACYINENGTAGKYSSAYHWRITEQFEGQVDYQKVKLENETLSWEAVEGAEQYYYVVWCGGQEVLGQTTDQTSFSCEELELGQYKVFVSAGVSNPSILGSDFGEGFSFKIERENVIQVQRQSEVLKITSKYEVNEFRVFVDGVLKLTAPALNLQNGVYTLDIATSQIDFASQKVEVCSSACGLYVKESAKVIVL